MAQKLKLDVVVDDNGGLRLLGQLDDRVKQVSSSAKSSAGAFDGLATFVNRAAAAFVGFVSAQVVMRGLREAFDFAKDAAFGMNSTLETSQLQFTTLMGSATRAKEHVASLFEYAKATPFETGPIIEASRLLQVMGGDALNTIDHIRLLGDVAAATGTPINELSVWFGRLYAMVQGGQPFGEATRRLIELGVISPQTATKLSDLQKSGASATTVFNEFTEALHRFDGGAADLATTWTGVTSTLTDSVQLMLADAFKPLFEAARDAIGMVNTMMGSEGFAGAMAQVQTVVASAIPSAADVLIGFLTVINSVAKGFSYIYETGKILAIGIDEIAVTVGHLISAYLELSEKTIQLEMILDPLGTKYEALRDQLDAVAMAKADVADATLNLRMREQEHLEDIIAMNTKVGELEGAITQAKTAVASMAAEQAIAAAAAETLTSANVGLAQSFAAIAQVASSDLQGLLPGGERAPNYTYDFARYQHPAAAATGDVLTNVAGAGINLPGFSDTSAFGGGGGGASYPTAAAFGGAAPYFLPDYEKPIRGIGGLLGYESQRTPYAPPVSKVTIEPGAFTINFPVINDKRALDQLARVVGDAVLARLKASGTRLPAGA